MGESEYEEVIIGRDYSRIGYFLLAVALLSGGIYLYKHFFGNSTSKKVLSAQDTIINKAVLKQTLQEAKKKPDSLSVIAKKYATQQIVVYFGYNRIHLDAQESKKLEGQFPNPIQSIQIKSYTDTDGSEASNKKLSFARAGSVAHWLSKTYPKQSFNILGLGEENPVLTNNKEDKKASRRAEIEIVY